MKQNIRITSILAVTAAIAIFAVASLADEPTSQTNAHLKKWLERLPKTDANGDGVLTASEVWASMQRKPQSPAKPTAKGKTAQPAKPAARPAAAALPKPDHENISYGPHERNVLDFWQAKSDKPAPLLVYIHGGGWMAGDKNTISPATLADCLKSGIAVAAINYRFTSTAMLPAPHRDSARAIQFLCSKAKEWNFDPKRVATYGGSAGAGITLWLAFHDDMADPKSDDPVARQSTRLCCGATIGGQSTYDPHVIAEWIGESAARHSVFLPAYNVKSYEELANPKLQPLYDEVSAIKHLTADDPPVFQIYSEPNVPLTPNVQIGQGMHSPIFGLKLKEAMDKLKIECVYLHTVEFDGNPNEAMVKFFRKHFGLK